MAKDLFYTITTFAVVIGVLVLAFWPNDKSSVIVVKYDCSVLVGAEPTDVPAWVLEECKKRKSKQ